MIMEKRKITKKEYFGQLREIVKDNAELVEFIDHEIELLARKNTGNSQTKVQKENVEVAKMLVDELAKLGRAVTITELMNESNTVKEFTLENGNKLTNQKISAIFKQLVESKEIVKVTDKKKSFFSVAE